MTKTKLQKKAEVKTTVTHVPSNSDAIKQFFDTVNKRDDGSNANGNLVKYLEMIRNVTSRSGSFSLQDVIALNRAPKYELPYEELLRYWNGWVKEMLRLNKIEEHCGAYEYPVYITIG